MLGFFEIVEVISTGKQGYVAGGRVTDQASGKSFYPIFLYEKEQVAMYGESDLKSTERVDHSARIAAANAESVGVAPDRRSSRNSVSSWDKALLHSFFDALVAGGVRDPIVIQKCIESFGSQHDVPQPYVEQFTRAKLKSLKG
jgi:hypothetical protein